LVLEAYSYSWSVIRLNRRFCTIHNFVQEPPVPLRAQQAMFFMRKDHISQSGIFTPRVLVAFALCSSGVLLGMFSLGATPRRMIGAEASPSGDWSIVPSPNVNEADKNNSFAATTCVSVSDCWAVGSSQTVELAGSAAQTLIERWNGTSWAIVPSPNTNAKQSNSLSAVTCVSASDCWAVGNYLSGGVAQTLAVHWDGTAWRIVGSPNSSATQNNSLAGVTCASTSDCWAVGVYFNAGAKQTFVQHWNGNSWSIVTSPNRPAQNNVLSGVACTSSSECWAVGHSENGTAAQTLIERWDGSTWTIVASPNILPVQFDFLSAVTCASTSDCWAVGNYIAGGNTQTLIEHWDGSSWTIVVSPNLGDAETTNALYGVTCSEGVNCWAVGISRTGPGAFRTLIERWNGTSWSIVTSPNTDAAQNNILNGVSCSSGSNCWAAGSLNTGSIFQTLIEQWNGSSWQIVSSPNSRATETTNVLSGTSCGSTSECWAVGYSWTGSVYRTLIERWNGNFWTIVPSPNTGATDNNSLGGVSCASASDCWAVGSSSNGTVAQALIERWDGTAWSIVASPVTLPNGLTAVTCVSTSDCWAVGSYLGGNTNQTLIERWNGMSWSIVISPNTRPAQSNTLSAVSCASASDCWAVGTYVNGSTFQTLIERWDGTSWTISTSPNSSATQNNLLRGVTCTSALDCWAAGYYWNGGAFQTLLEHWNGSSWLIVPSPNTSATQSNECFGVSCASESNCWAAGFYLEANNPRTLIEQWDGTSWTITTSPNTSATEANLLYGVACAPDSNCWAVGYYHTGTVYQTLTARYATAAQLVGVVSRKVHGDAGSFDVDLPLTGNPGIECRDGGANADYTLVFNFANPLNGVGGASVTSGTGSIANSNIDNNDAHNYIVNLTAINNAQIVTISLTNVNDAARTFSSAVSVSMGVMLGDVNANGIVSNTDVAEVKAQVGAPVTASNFRTDVHANGVVSNTDVSAVKTQVGATLP
jgi:hypothetical protein